jgi:hypothetical protein
MNPLSTYRNIALVQYCVKAFRISPFAMGVLECVIIAEGIKIVERSGNSTMSLSS